MAQKKDEKKEKLRTRSIETEVRITACDPKLSDYISDKNLIEQMRLGARAKNYALSLWLQYHMDRGTDAKITESLKQDAQYKADNPRPRLVIDELKTEQQKHAIEAKHLRDVKAWKEGLSDFLNPLDFKDFELWLGTSMYVAVARKFPDMPGDRLTDIAKWVAAAVTAARPGQASGMGTAPAWYQMILNAQPLPSVSFEPITIPKSNVKFGIDGDAILCRVPLVRTYGNSGSGKKVYAYLEMKTGNHRREYKYAAIIKQVLSGEIEYGACKLMQRKRKWILSVVIKEPRETVETDPKKELHILAGRDECWRARVYEDGALVSQWVPMADMFGRIKAARQRTFRKVEDRSNSYRNGGKRRRGNGRKRAMNTQGQHGSSREKSILWGGYVKNETEYLTNAIMRAARGNKCSRIVFHQPGERWEEYEKKDGGIGNRMVDDRKTRAVSRAGNRDNAPVKTTWPFYKVGERLQQKTVHGISVVIDKKGSVYASES